MKKKQRCDGAATFSVYTEQKWMEVQSNGKFVRTSVSNPIRVRGRGASRRRNKGLRVMGHHASAGEGSSWAGDLVQRKRKNKVLREFLHQVRSRGVAPPPEPDAGNPSLCASSDPDPLFSRNERSRCTKCTAASSVCYAFFWGCKFKGGAPPSPAAPANFRAYIGRLGMRTVKVVPLSGTLST